MGRIKFKIYKNSNETLYRDYDFENDDIPVTSNGRLEIDSSISKNGSKSLKYSAGESLDSYDAKFNIKIRRNNKPSIESWIYLDNGVSAAGVCILQQSTEKGSYTQGYCALISTIGALPFSTSKDTTSTFLDIDSEVSVVANTWYKVKLYIDNNDNIVAELYDQNESLLSTLNSTDSDYVSGSYGLVSTAASNNFDDVKLKIIGGKFKKVIRKINYKKR